MIPQNIRASLRTLAEGLRHSHFTYVSLDTGDTRIVVDTEATSLLVSSDGAVASQGAQVINVDATSPGIFQLSSDWGSRPVIGRSVTAGMLIGTVTVLDEVVEIRTERAGEVIGLLVADGEFVQYGQSLIQLSPESSHTGFEL